MSFYDIHHHSEFSLFDGKNQIPTPQLEELRKAILEKVLNGAGTIVAERKDPDVMRKEDYKAEYRNAFFKTR